MPKSQSQVNVETTIKEGLAYVKNGDLNFATGKLALAIQLISHLDRDRKPVKPLFSFII